MAAAAVDLASLSSHLDVPEATLTTVTIAPTIELVISVLQAVAEKAHEYNTLYAEKLRVDIELENVVRSSEALCGQFKTTADNALKDVEEARQKLRNEGKPAVSIFYPVSIIFSLASRLTRSFIQRAHGSLLKTSFKL
jgi:nucleoprotein TPR